MEIFHGNIKSRRRMGQRTDHIPGTPDHDIDRFFPIFITSARSSLSPILFSLSIIIRFLSFTPAPVSFPATFPPPTLPLFCSDKKNLLRNPRSSAVLDYLFPDSPLVNVVTDACIQDHKPAPFTKIITYFPFLHYTPLHQFQLSFCSG